MDVQVTNYYILHYHFDKVAGTERVLFNIIEFLSKKADVKIHLLLLKHQHKLVFDLAEFPIEIHFLNVKSYLKSDKLNLVKTIFETSRKLSRFFKGVNLDKKSVLLTTNVYLAFAANLSKSRTKFKNLEIVSCEHFTVTATSKITNAFRHLFYSKINVVMLTESDRSYIEVKYNPKICVCIPNAIPFELKPYQGLEAKSIISIGRYTHQKGFDLLIKSFALIAEDFPDWSLKIIGDDYGDRDKMQKLILQNNISNIELLPATPNISEFYKEASFYVMSSRFEGLPMVLLEALGFGLPIVSFDCPTGPAQVVSDLNGFLVENGNIFELAESMKKLILDSNLRKLKSEGSQMVANKFSKERINKMWDDFFKKL